MDSAFQYVETIALEQEADYPYEASDDSCRADATKGVAKVTGFTDVTPNNPA